MELMRNLKKRHEQIFLLYYLWEKKMVLRKNSFGFFVYWIENENDTVTEMITSFICVARILDERK